MYSSVIVSNAEPVTTPMPHPASCDMSVITCGSSFLFPAQPTSVSTAAKNSTKHIAFLDVFISAPLYVFLDLQNIFAILVFVGNIVHGFFHHVDTQPAYLALLRR